MTKMPKFSVLTVAAMFAALLAAAAATLVSPNAQAGNAQVGAEAPSFDLPDQNGKRHKLADYAGRWVALYFYPKDDTPGCTKEACDFRDNVFAFRKIGAEIIGVSTDDVSSHKAFAEKYGLPFPLLADRDGRLSRAYGVYATKGVMKYAKRQSFLIDPEGHIVRHYQKVDPESHSKEVLADLRELMVD